MPSYDAIMDMITDKSKESVLVINLFGSEQQVEPLVVETVGDVYFKNMGAAIMLIYIPKETGVIVKRLFDPTKYDVLSKRVNPVVE